jgi:hypothetical protein
MNEFISFGLSLYTGHKLFTFYPLNVILFPLARLFDLDAPIVQVTEYE